MATLFLSDTCPFFFTNQFFCWPVLFWDTGELHFVLGRVLSGPKHQMPSLSALCIPPLPTQLVYFMQGFKGRMLRARSILMALVSSVFPAGKSRVAQAAVTIASQGLL